MPKDGLYLLPIKNEIRLGLKLEMLQPVKATSPGGALADALRRAGVGDRK